VYSTKAQADTLYNYPVSCQAIIIKGRKEEKKKEKKKRSLEGVG